MLKRTKTQDKDTTVRYHAHLLKLNRHQPLKKSAKKESVKKDSTVLMGSGNAAAGPTETPKKEIAE